MTFVYLVSLGPPGIKFKNKNLTTGQRAAFAALTVLEMRKELGIEGRGRPEKIAKNGNFSGKNLRDIIAREWHVSHSIVQLALNTKKVSDEFFQVVPDLKIVA